MSSPSRPPKANAAARSRRWTFLALAGIVLVAAGLRLVGLDTQPWGVHGDQLEVSVNGLAVLHGQLPARLSDYNVWVHALAFWLLGPSPAAVRFLPALVGSLFPVSVYLALKGLFGRRPALLAGALAALALWPIALSRSGFSISYLPVVLSLCLWQLEAGWRTGRARHWLAAGALLAAAQYIYIPARALLLVLGAAAVYVLVFGPRRRLLAAWPLLPPFLLGILPLLGQTAQITAETDRYGTVFLFAYEYNSREPLAAIARQIGYAVSMFFVQGDSVFRHNVARQPIYNGLVALAALPGLGVLVREWRRPRTLFWLAWMGGMLAPMLLSIESPHFLRAVGSLPLAFVPPALGLDYLWRLAEQRGRARLGAAAVAVTLVLSLGHSLYTYFGPGYRGTPELAYAFYDHKTRLAVDINQFLGVGWQGAGWLVRDTTPTPGRVLWLDRELMDEFDFERNVQLLVPLALDATPAFRSIQSAGQGASEAPVSAARLIVRPGHEQPGVGLLPRGQLIRIADGPLPAAEPPDALPLYRVYTTEDPAGLPTQPVACFGEGIELLSATTAQAGDHVALELLWRATGQPSFDFTVFVHLVAQEAVVSQIDAYPAAGRYLTTWWRPGDVIADAYELPVPPGTDLTDAYLRVGLYRWDTVVNLPATDCAGQSLGEFATVPLAGIPMRQSP
jgi:hypothetical protein